MEGTDVAESFKVKYNADLLGEWLTLQMGREEMSSFADTQGKWDPKLSRPPTPMICGTGRLVGTNIHLKHIQDSIDSIVSKFNPAVKRRQNFSNCPLRLRRATESDAKSILKLVHGLASYEKALDEVHVDETIYQIDGGGENPLYHCILLEEDKGENENDVGAVIGMGFFYFGHSMVNGGRFLYLEDLFIEKEYRGCGYGKAIMYVLAEIAQRLHSERFVWQALDWNAPALKFYNSIGAEICDGLITLRFDKERIDDYEFHK